MSVLADIFYLPNFGCFDKTGVFQQTQAISLIVCQRPFPALFSSYQAAHSRDELYASWRFRSISHASQIAGGRDSLCSSSSGTVLKPVPVPDARWEQRNAKPKELAPCFEQFQSTGVIVHHVSTDVIRLHSSFDFFRLSPPANISRSSNHSCQICIAASCSRNFGLFCPLPGKQKCERADVHLAYDSARPFRGSGNELKSGKTC